MTELQFPTNEEIEEAWRGIEAAGPGAHETAVLAMHTLRNNRLADGISRMVDVYCKTLGIPASKERLVQGLVMGAVVTGLNYGLRIGDARVVAATKAPTDPPTALTETELWAWLGEDDQVDIAKQTGQIGLKQAQTPAGMIPMVGVLRQKMEKFFPQFEAQALRFGKRIRLCRFTFAEVVRETDHGT